MLVPTDWIAPTITGIFGLVLAIVTGVLASRGRRLGNRESRMPDVTDLWVQQEQDRRMRQLVEDLWWNVRRAFQSYYRRVNSAALALHLPADKMAAFELTKRELSAIESELPTEPTDRPIPTGPPPTH